MEILYPDYENSALGTVNAILSHYGAQTRHAPLSMLQDRLKTAGRNVVFLVLDALGLEVLERHARPEGFFRSHLMGALSPVFPCTTVAAMNSYYSGLSPAEHGWLGWSLFFKEYGRVVDTYLNRDSFTQEAVQPPPAYTLMPYESIFTALQRAGVECHSVSPFPSPYCDCYKIEAGFEDQLRAVGELCARPGERFIMGYFTEPDALMHRLGPGDERAGALVRALEAQLESAFQTWPQATLILSADHGMTSIGRILYIDEMPELMELLVLQPFIESRAASFFVKRGREALFEERFRARLGKDFLLMDHDQALKKLFGPGKPHPKTLDFVGDYLALGISDAMLESRGLGQNHPKQFRGQHAGLTRAEMRIPLIVAQNR